MPFGLLTSDVHLSPEHGRATSQALAGLMAEYAGADVHLVGDIFDLSQTPLHDRPENTLHQTLAAHPEWVDACKNHLARGGRLSFVTGNHDAELDGEAAKKLLFATLAPADDRTLSVSPWFYRRGRVHIEHGHLYDADCAPNHPLSPASAASEGLGTALVRRFLAPSRSLEFAHAHELTPRSGLLMAVQKWGARAPAHILWYFRTAATLCLETLTAQPARQAAKAVGNAALPEHAERTGVSVPLLRALLEGAPDPTHHAFSATFLRLYFDRLIAGGGAGVGASLLAAGTAMPPLLAPGAITTVAALGYLFASSGRSKRHKAGPVQALEIAAEHIRNLTDCSLVVFGHSHVASERPGYVNAGSFAFSRGGRPYVLVDQDDRAEIRYVAR